MGDTEQYISLYKQFFEDFNATVNPDDQLPVKVAGYNLCESEILGEIIDWSFQYLNAKHCPSSLLVPLTRIVVDEVHAACKGNPVDCGFRLESNVFQSLKLMKVVTNKVNEVCQRFYKNGLIDTLPRPTTDPPLSVCAVKNTRRRMEDRHIIIEDFDAMFGIQNQNRTSYYAIFDGHAGTDAAAYSVSHLHQFIAESPNYPSNPEKALKDAFFKTDTLFLEKSNVENLRSGTTALCALLRPKDNILHVAWLGDSQAILVRRDEIMRIVNPHKPDRKDERLRIENMGGCVLFWGTWRVNGQLAVSRAIGDLEYKPYVTAEPDVLNVQLNGTEDFLLLGCDGLWDFASDAEILQTIYKHILETPGDIDGVTECLVQLSKKQGSTDNITIIVVFLTEPTQIAARLVDDPQFWERLSNMDTSSAATNGEDSIAYQKAGVLDFTDGAPDPSLGFKHNGLGTNASDIFFLERSTNGKSAHGHYDDDFGPETDVDAVDDILMPTTGSTIKSVDNPFLQQDTNEDLEIQRQQSREFDPIQESREEAPTPPADKVKNVGVYVPDSENVGDSGEESEDEWNYYRVEPTGTTAPTLETKQTNQEVCETSASGLEDPDDMEYRLNPDAAEFVPSPTRMKPSIEEIISQSPMKAEELKEVTLIPSEEEFNKEIRLRPGEYDNGAPVLPDILNTDSGTGSNEADDSGNLEESLEDEGFYRESSGNWNNDTLIATNINVDKSMFTNSTSVLEQSENVSSVLERSFIEKSDVGNSVLGTTDVLSNVSGNAESSNPFDIDSLASYEPEKLTTENSIGIKDLSDAPILEDSEHVDQTQVMSFELQKDVAPEMEPIPERVHIDNEESNVFTLGDQIISTNIDFETAPPTLEYTSDNFDAAPIPEYDGSFGVPTYDGTPNVTLSDIQPTVSSLNHPLDFSSNFSVPDFTSNFSVPELSSIYVTDTETVVLNEDTFKSKPQHSPIPEEIESLENVIKREEELIDSTSMLNSTNLIDSSNVLPDSVLDKPSVFDNSLIETSEYQNLTFESDAQLPKESPSPLPAHNEQLHDLSSVCSFSAAAYSQPISESENLQTTDFVPYTTDLDPTDPNHPLYRCVYPLPPDILDQQSQHNIIQDIQENSLIQNIEESSQISQTIDDQSQLEKGGFTQDPFGSSTVQIDEPSVLAPDNIQENSTIENDKPFISEISEQKTDNLLDNSLEIIHEGNKLSFEDNSHASMEEPAVQQTAESCLDELITAEPQHLVTATPPPTPAVISEDPFSSSITSANFNSISEPVQKVEAEETKDDAETKIESSGEAGLGLDTVSVAAVSATAAATAVAVGESILQTKTSEQKVPDKKEIGKKTAVTKEKKPLSDKSKVSAITKSTASPKTSTVTSKAPVKAAVSSSKSTPSPLKSTPTSPTKPLSSPLVSTKKPATPPANKTKPVTSTATKSASPQVKTLSSNSSPRPASATSKARPTTAPVNKTVTDKKPLTLTNGIAPKTSPNGIVSKTSTKRIEQLPLKKLVSSVSSSRTTTRPSTVLSKTTTSTNTTSVNTTKVSSNITQNRTTAVSSTRPKTAPPSGLTAKPKVLSTTNTVSRIKSSTTTTAPTKSVEKHVKETANKQISSVRNGISATKSTSVASRTVSKTSGSVTKTTTTTVTKQNPVRKVGIKKTTTTTTTTNPAKQNNVNLENNELISEQIETTIITEVKFDPSPIEIAQEAVTE